MYWKCFFLRQTNECFDIRNVRKPHWRTEYVKCFWHHFTQYNKLIKNAHVLFVKVLLLLLLVVIAVMVLIASLLCYVCLFTYLDSNVLFRKQLKYYFISSFISFTDVVFLCFIIFFYIIFFRFPFCFLLFLILL